MPLEPAQVARFAAEVRRLLDGEQVGPDRPLALAVSGGADSMAMLALGTEAFPGAVIAATVDHGLRPDSAGEAAMVARRCDEIGVPHSTLRPGVPITGASIQAQARDTRYALLSALALDRGAAALATAHHADDQAETFLMRAARGSGVAGLAGIRARRLLGDVEGRSLPLIRPLLGWRRAELRGIAAAGGAFVDDPSNADPRHDRSRFRRLVEDSPELDVVRIAAAAAHAAEAQQALDAVTAMLWEERFRQQDGQVTIAFDGLPRELRRRLVRRAIGQVLARPFEDAGVEPLLDALEAGQTATRAGVMMTCEAAIATFRMAPPRRSH